MGESPATGVGEADIGSDAFLLLRVVYVQTLSESFDLSATVL